MVGVGDGQAPYKTGTCALKGPVPSSVYHAIFLEELTTLELIEKIANLYSISPQHIHRVYRQGPTGIHVVVSNEVSGGLGLLGGAAGAAPQMPPVEFGGDFSLKVANGFYLNATCSWLQWLPGESAEP